MSDLQKIARAYAEKDTAKALPLCFAFGRLKAINAILSYNHGGPCRGEDAPMYFGLMLPYSVEIAHLRPVAGFKDAMRRYRWWLPGIVDELGEDGIGERWNELCQERSISKARFRTESAVGHVDWLPTAQRIATETRLTYAQRAAINARYPGKPPIRGIPVIDPPTTAEKRELDRIRKETKRRADGVVPQDERTLTADAAALAKLVPCNEKTIRRHRDAGTLEAFLQKRGVNVQKVSAPSSYTWDGQKLDILAEDPEAALWTPESEAMAVLRELLSAPLTAALEDDFMRV